MTDASANLEVEASPAVRNNNPTLCAGDWVEVRSKVEILRTLDSRGRLDGMPFMPEMFAFCGNRYRVYKRAHKTCDTVYEYKGRKLKDAVHLDGLRCDGEAHGGCQAACLIFWKTAWLRPLTPEGGDASPHPAAVVGQPSDQERHCSQMDVVAGTRQPGTSEAEPSYVCQATQVPAATEFLPWWEWRQYVEDYTSGNVGLVRILKSFAYVGYRHCLVNLGIGVGAPLKWLYDAIQKLRGGVPYPSRRGKLPVGSHTPSARLDLQPGEWVRVKSYEAIRATCDELDTNRGLRWDREMVPYCGGTYRVLNRVTKILNEKTGKMQEMKNACIILDGVICEARYSDCRLFCPRSIYPYWREIWLERAEDPTAVQKPGTSNQLIRVDDLARESERVEK